MLLVSLLKECLGCLILPTGCAGLPNHQAAPGKWPGADVAHQAATADGAQGGSMRDDSVPNNPPGDAPRSARLPHQAGGGPQDGVPQGVQSQLPLCQVSHSPVEARLHQQVCSGE